MEGHDQHTKEQPAKRSMFLTVLCILTFISCGLGVMRTFIITPMADFMIEFIKQSPGYNADAYTEQFLLMKAGWAFYMVSLLPVLLALAGAIMMWNLKKNGFHFYTIANIILLSLPVVWLNLHLNFAEVFFTSLFVTMYASQMKYMR